MNKAKLLAFLSEAIDKGWNIEVTANSWGESKSQAMDRALKLSEITDLSITPNESEGFQWLVVGSVTSKVRGVFHYETFMEEDITFEEDEEIA